MKLFTEGIMREMTGAAGTAKEPGDIRAQYFPGAFQRTDPDLWKSLETTRQAQIDAAYRNSGLPDLSKRDKNVPVPPPSRPLPSEEDILHTMKVNGMSRAAVLKALGYQ
jgi:hypothetical protein